MTFILEGTDLIGKTTIKNRLQEKGLEVQDRKPCISSLVGLKPTIFDIEQMYVHLDSNPNWLVIILYTSDTRLLRVRLAERMAIAPTTVDEYDKLAVRYNKAYIRIFTHKLIQNLCNKTKRICMIDVANKTIEDLATEVYNVFKHMIIRMASKKIFVGSVYNVQHKDVTDANCTQILADDLRAKLVGVENFVYGSKEVGTTKGFTYVGGFYYEHLQDAETEKELTDQETVVWAEKEQIDKADIVAIVLLKKGGIATVSELLYAASKQKKVIVYCDPTLTNESITSEYWFPIILAQKMNADVTVVYVHSEEDVVKHIENLWTELSKEV